MHFNMPKLTMDTALPGASLPWQSGLQMGIAWVDEASWTRTCHLSKGLTGVYTIQKWAARRACQETGALPQFAKMTGLYTGQLIFVTTIDHRTLSLPLLEESSSLCSCTENHVFPLHCIDFMGSTRTGHGTCFEVACPRWGDPSHAFRFAAMDHGHGTSGD